jgi:type I restriction enzyme R subunit
LTEHGTMEPSGLCDSPLTDLSPRGPDGLFNPKQLDLLMATPDGIAKTAQVVAWEASNIVEYYNLSC